MSPWIESIIRAAVQGCILAAATFVLTILWKRLGPSYRCALWWLVLAEFAFGWLVTAPIRMSAPERLAGVGATIQATAQKVVQASPAQAAASGEPASHSYAWLVVGIWALGFGVTRGAGAIGTARMSRIRREAVPASDEVQGDARRIAAELGLPTPAAVAVSSRIQSPATFGLRKPCVLVPESFSRLTPAEREMVLAHELGHVLRRDALFALVPELASAVFWFFPVVFLVRRAWAVERELACDALVYSRPNVDATSYRRLLLKIVERDAVPMPRTALGATADFRCLRRRLLAGPAPLKPAAKFGGAAALLFLSLMAVPVSFQAREADGGLLENAGFEEGGIQPDRWSQGGRIDTVRYIWDGKVARTGRRSISIVKTEDRYYPIAQWSQAVPYDGKSTEIEFGGWVKTEKAYKAILDVLFVGEEGLFAHQWVAYVGAKEYGDPPVTHDWKRLGGVAKIPAGTNRIMVALQLYGPGQVWLDDASARFVPAKK